MEGANRKVKGAKIVEGAKWRVPIAKWRVLK